MRENGAVRRGIQHIRECLRALLLRALIGKGGNCSGVGGSKSARGAGNERKSGGQRRVAGKCYASGRGAGGRRECIAKKEERECAALRGQGRGAGFRCGGGRTRAYVRIIYNIAKFV